MSETPEQSQLYDYFRSELDKRPARLTAEERYDIEAIISDVRYDRQQELQDTRRKQRAFDEAKNRSDGECTTA